MELEKKEQSQRISTGCSEHKSSKELSKSKQSVESK